MTATPPFAHEPTQAGAQALVPGVAPIGERERLLLRAAAPLGSAKPQRPADHGLFDLAARDQLDLFDELPPTRRLTCGPSGRDQDGPARPDLAVAAGGAVAPSKGATP